MLFTENYSELPIDKYFPDTFCVQKGNYYCTPLLLNMGIYRRKSEKTGFFVQ